MLECLHARLAAAFFLVAIPVVAVGQKTVFTVIQPVGCNATSLAQVPGSTELFLGRQLLTADGQIAGVTGPNDCSGGNPDNRLSGKVFNRWALTLSTWNWSAHKLTLRKVLLDTSIDPDTKQSHAILTGGSMRGAIITSAYDPTIVRFDGQFLVAYECTLENDNSFAVQGTSVCISIYEPRLQMIDLNRTQVIISGTQISPSEFVAAAVPALLVYRRRLFLYWSALSIENGRFAEICIRGAELLLTAGRLSIKGAEGAIVKALDEPTTTPVWTPSRKDPLTSTTVDLRAIWVAGKSIVVAASLGGMGCTAPSDAGAGCYRLALVQTDEPMTDNAFGRGRQVNPETLPSNPQEYTQPVRDPSGSYWFLGHYVRPDANGVSDAHPMPNATFWSLNATNSVLVMFPSRNDRCGRRNSKSAITNFGINGPRIEIA
jgi:hypothetical protein